MSSERQRPGSSAEEPKPGAVPYRDVSGLRPPLHPTPGTDALTVAFHYLDQYEREFARARSVVKRRASDVVVATATGSGAIAVVGAATAVTGFSWLGVVSAALAGLIGVVGAWDSHFRHRELWVQRSLVLGQLQALRRSAELRRALGEDPETLAADVLHQLDAILQEDLTTWSEVRRSRPPQAGGGPASASNPS